MKDILLVLPEIVLLSLTSLLLVVDLFVGRTQKHFTFACGIGALLWKPEFKTAAITIERAEVKLKAAKEGGRNRIAS